MTAIDRAALLADVAAICIISIRYDANQLHGTGRVERAERMKFLLSDERLYSTYPRDRKTLVDDVMQKYCISRSRARYIICEARKYGRAETQTPPAPPVADAL